MEERNAVEALYAGRLRTVPGDTLLIWLCVDQIPCPLAPGDPVTALCAAPPGSRRHASLSVLEGAMEAGLLPAGDPAVHIVEALAAWRKLFGGYDPAPDAPVLLFPGASRQDKAWPPESFASLARLLARRGKKAHWVLGPVEQERRFPVPPDISVHAPQDLPALAALLRSAALAVGNDSGPLHLAAMHGVPVLSLFGPTDPDIWRPLEGHVLTKLSIPPEQVLETALGLLWTGPEQNARP